jgi:hypothetical protein
MAVSVPTLLTSSFSNSGTELDVQNEFLRRRKESRAHFRQPTKRLIRSRLSMTRRQLKENKK